MQALPPILAVVVPLWHDADTVHSVVLVRRQRAWDAVCVEVLVALQAGRRRLDPRPGAALPAQSLVSHGALVHGGVVAVSQLRGGVASHPAQPGHQRSRGKVSGEVLVGQPLHLLHGGDRAASIGRDAGPRVAAYILQAGNRLRPLRGAGVHAGLPLAGLTAVGPPCQAEALGVANRTIVMVVLTGGALQVGLLVAVLSCMTVVFHCKQLTDCCWLGVKLESEKKIF